jgi:hypothetical protein
MEIRFSNWRQLLWPQDSAAWDRYELLPLSRVPESAALRPRLVPADALAPEELRQLLDALAAGAVAARLLQSLGALLARIDEVYEGRTDIAEYVLGSPVEWWDLEDVTAGLPAEARFTLLLYGIDCGVIYDGRGETRIGDVVQGALWCNDHPPLWKALARSQAAMRAQAPKSRLAQVALNAAVRCPSCERLEEIWVADFADAITCSHCGRAFDAIAAMGPAIGA